MSNMIKCFYVSELDCPQHTGDINSQRSTHSWTTLYRCPRLFNLFDLFKLLIKFQHFIFLYIFLLTVFIVVHQRQQMVKNYLAKYATVIIVCPGHVTCSIFCGYLSEQSTDVQMFSVRCGPRHVLSFELKHLLPSQSTASTSSDTAGLSPVVLSDGIMCFALKCPCLQRTILLPWKF